MLTRTFLSEGDAWDIAMAWRDQLRGCVRLELDSEEIPSSIIPVFEWVTFVFHGTLRMGCREVEDRPKAAAYARAAMLAWFALSCCDGYSGVENPHFWKRVFYELLYPEGLPSFKERGSSCLFHKQLPITDAIRFFDQPDRPFPRVKLAHEGNEADTTVGSVFLGRLPHEDDERDAKLQLILAKLEPFTRKSDATRDVPVQLELYKLPTAEHAELLSSVPRGESTSRASVAVACVAEFPQLYLRAIKFVDDQRLDIQSLYSLIPLSDVDVVVGGSLPSFVQDHQLWRGLLDQLQGSSSVGKHHKWRVTDVDVKQNTDLSFSHLCSALPHLQSVHSLKLSARRYLYGPSVSIASDWAWLGYAIFHPDAASTSGLKSLEVDLDGMSAVDIADLAKMAVGNNFLGDERTGYIEGRVRCGTEASRQEVRGGQPALYTITSEVWVSMTTTQAGEAHYHQDLVWVVIPGFGSGWIHRENVLETRSRRAGQSCVRVLRVKNYSEDPIEDTTKETLLGLLRVLGSRLISLHFKNSNHVSASAVHAILSLCPSLKRLRIHHDGSFWADEALAMEMPRLEELELTVHGRYIPVKTTDAYRAEVARYRRSGGGRRPRREWETGPVRPLQELKPSCLPYLKALHVTSARYGGYEQHESVLVPFLSQQPVLQYLHWSRNVNCCMTWADAPPYRENECTHQFLAQLPAEHHLSLSPLHLNCRLAFLSVVGDNAAESSVCQLGKDVILVIFQYAPSPSRREVFINRYVLQSGII